MNKKTLLIVDDEKDLLESLCKYLNKQGFAKILTAKTIQEAKFQLEREDIDLLVLDLMLPDGSGFDLLKDLRQKSKLPVIILSALDGVEDRREGFTYEADDYIVKPFLPEDLLWRIQAVLRRTSKNLDTAQVDLGNLLFDRDRAILIRDGKEEKLTAKQFKILDLLSRNPNRIVSIDQILEEVWGDSYGYENTLITHIYRLREKLEKDPSQPKILVTIRGLGYKLVSKS